MVLKNIRKDLAYKNTNNIVMLQNSLYSVLSIDQRLMYSLISNFENGLDTNNIFELMLPKGWEEDILKDCINVLLDLNYIEDISNDYSLERINKEFEEFKKVLSRF
ncbi:MAG: hypothetical protein ACRCXA_10740 [Peptostreptococcaceae bacterium]